MVDFVERLVRQADAVDFPAAHGADGIGWAVVKVLVKGFQEAEVVGVDVLGVRVGDPVRAKDNPVLMADEEFPRRVGLAAQLVDARGDVDVHVRMAVHHCPDLLQVLGPGAGVRDDKGGFGVVLEHRFLHVHVLLKAEEALVIELPFRHVRQALVILVGLIRLVKEGDRVG